MSFCAKVKNELAAIRPAGCCKSSLIYGFLLFGRSFSYKRIALQTTNAQVAKYYSELISSYYSANVNITVGGNLRPTYKADVTSPADRLKILADFDFGVLEEPINREVFLRDCCVFSFLRGAFLACGNINNPEKEYRIEFSVKNEKLADNLNQILLECGTPLTKTARGNAFVLYTKESEKIEDLLTILGDSKRTLDIIDTKIMKSVKNNINRRGNCDNANISKTVDASIKQRTAIEYLIKNDKLYGLPQELLSVAILRQENPEATLKELCRISTEPLTVSGLNHRLSKIIKLYEKLTENL